MEIEILQQVEGAKNARGLTVIIDVFRAFTVEAYLTNNGVEKLIAIGDKEIAYKYKEVNKDVLLIGERGGSKLPGFDYGNSPSQICDIDFTGKTILHTTSSGTQGIVNAVYADEIITGSLVNAKAIAEYIKQVNPQRVSLVAMGTRVPTEEDTLCARYIKSLLENTDNTINMEKEIESLKNTSGAKFFDKEQNDVFPENDFYLSTEINKFKFVLKVEKQDDGLHHVRKIDIDY